MTDRCDLSGLLVEQCACRVHGPEDDRGFVPYRESAFSPPPPGLVFAATYTGVCVDCRDRIDPGDRIASAVDGGYLHAECWTPR